MKLLWVRPGQPAPAGYRPTGIVSLWQHTGRVRTELWEAPLSGDVCPCGDPGAIPEGTVVPAPESLLAPPTAIYREGEKRT